MPARWEATSRAPEDVEDGLPGVRGPTPGRLHLMVFKVATKPGGRGRGPQKLPSSETDKGVPFPPGRPVEQEQRGGGGGGGAHPG